MPAIRRPEPAPVAAGQASGVDEQGDSEPPLRPGRATLGLEVVQVDGDWSGFGDIEQLARRMADVLARHAAFREYLPAEATIALSSDREVRTLNKRWRGKDKPTNVLSFPAPPDPTPAGGGPRLLGDIVLAAETVLAGAREQEITAVDHLQHLVVHGLLHLLGHDHETRAEAERMEALEVEILARLGVADPYAGSEPVAGSG